jgi:hypothetical protein
VLGIEPNALSVPRRPCSSARRALRLRRQGRQRRRGPPDHDQAHAGGETVVGSGLKAGEQVVVDGQLRLVNGAAVAAKPRRPRRPSRAPPRG